MENHTQSEQLFDLNAEVGKLLAHPEMQKSLAKPGSKEAWIAYLSEGAVDHFDQSDETDRVVAEMIFGLLTTYAFLAGSERFQSDPAVARYMKVLHTMYQGQDVEKEIDEAAEQLPEDFKKTVSSASQFAQDYLVKRLQELA